MTIERDHLGFDAPAPLGHPGRLGLPEGQGTGPEVGEKLPDFELPDEEWPAPDTGTQLAWMWPVTEQTFDVYWFAGYYYYDSGTAFYLAPHPLVGGNFYDDSIPTIADEIVDYGFLGFGTNPGYNPCPPPPVFGACCFDDGRCEFLPEFTCYGVGGTDWLGPDSTCDPNPCDDTSSVPTTSGVTVTSWGRIKSQHR